MQKDYSFYNPPQVSFYLDKETLFEKNARQILSDEAVTYSDSMENASNTDAKKTTEVVPDEKLLKKLSDESLDKLREIVE